MTEKREISHIAAVGVIYGPKPGEVLLEGKTPGYLWEKLVGNFFIFGGSKEKADNRPRDTFIRELREEISFDKIRAGSWQPSRTDQKKLEDLRQAICESCRPLADFECHIPEEFFNIGEPGYTKWGMYFIVSVWQAGLASTDWETLVELQQKSGNLSRESQSRITSLDEILRGDIKIAPVQDRLLKTFFLSKGLRRAINFPLVPGATIDYCGPPLKTYKEYLKFHNIAKRS